MRRLTAIRLVNWYHFQDQLIQVDRSCALLGNTGSGKSTVLDAIQWALVADQSAVRFNKAANEHSRRGLHGYVCWKLGSEDDTRPGHVRFGRSSSTSYVILEFEDDRDARDQFVCGTVLEAVASDVDVRKSFFVIPSARAADVPATEGDAVCSAQEFRALVNARFANAKRSSLDAGTYRDEVRHRLGALPMTFHRLLVKALDFRPLRSVREFVLHYLLDPRPIDTEALQANLEHYKKLEAQAADARRRLTALDQICMQGERIAQERRTIESHHYVYLRADGAVKTEQVGSLERARDAARLEGDAAHARGERLEQDRLFTEGELDRVRALLVGSPAWREIQAVTKERQRAAADLDRAQEDDRRARDILAEQDRLLDLLLSQQARDVRRLRPGYFEDELVGAYEAPPIVERLRAALTRQGALAGRDLRTWTGCRWARRTAGIPTGT